MPRGPRCPRSFRNSLRRDGAARHGRDEPASGHRDRRRNAAPRRQRRRRRDCGERRARAHGADELRHRRRPVRHRLGRGQRAPARLERERPRAAVADARPAAGNGAYADSRPRPAQRQRARRRRRLVRAARTLRPLAAARAPRTLDRLRARGFSRDGSHRRVVGRGCQCSAGQSRLCRGVHAERPSARDRRAIYESGARAGVRAHCERGPRRVLRRPDCGGHRRLRAGQRRVLRMRGSCGASLRVGRAGVYDVSRLERLRAAAERSRHRRVADAEHPRRVRSRVARVG